MNVELLQDVIRQRIRQRLFSEQNSHREFKELMLAAGEQRQIPAFNQLWFLIGDVEGISIESTYGEYDRGNFSADEQQHEHTDHITLFNYSQEPVHVKFLQVILRK